MLTVDAPMEPAPSVHWANAGRNLNKHPYLEQTGITVQPASVSPHEISIGVYCRKHQRPLINLHVESTGIEGELGLGLLAQLINAWPIENRYLVAVSRECPTCGELKKYQVSGSRASGGIVCRHDRKRDALLFKVMPGRRIRIACEEQVRGHAPTRVSTKQCWTDIDLDLITDAVIDGISESLTIA